MKRWLLVCVQLMAMAASVIAEVEPFEPQQPPAIDQLGLQGFDEQADQSVDTYSVASAQNTATLTPINLQMTSQAATITVATVPYVATDKELEVATATIQATLAKAGISPDVINAVIEQARANSQFVNVFVDNAMLIQKLVGAAQQGQVQITLEGVGPGHPAIAALEKMNLIASKSNVNGVTVLRLNPPNQAQASLQTLQLAMRAVSEQEIAQIIASLGFTDLALNIIKERYPDVKLAEGGEREKLPRFFTGITVAGRVVPGAEQATDYTGLRLPVKVLRLMSVHNTLKLEGTTPITTHAAQLRNLMRSEPKTKFILVADMESLTGEYVTLINEPNTMAILLGHYIAADVDARLLAGYADRVKAELDVVRAISNKPVLLGCSVVTYATALPASGWAKLFDLTKFDGFAVYNMHNWAAFEIQTREQVASTLGLPKDMPMIAMDFIGTKKVDDRSQQVWQQKGEPLLQRLQSQGWRGLALYCRSKEEAQQKEGVLLKANPKLLFTPAN